MSWRERNVGARAHERGQGMYGSNPYSDRGSADNDERRNAREWEDGYREDQRREERRQEERAREEQEQRNMHERRERERREEEEEYWARKAEYDEQEQREQPDPAP